MPRETFVLVLEGVWASVTGGWYYDKKQSDFSNLFHLYIWLLFLCLPFLNYLFLNSTTSWAVYVVLIGTLFFVIKLINLYFHRLFDTAKCIEEDPIAGENDDQVGLNSISPASDTIDKDVFELRDLNTRTRCTYGRPTPPTWNPAGAGDESRDKSEPTNSSQKVDCRVDVHFDDSVTVTQPLLENAQSSVFDLSNLFDNSSDDCLSQEKEKLLTTNEEDPEVLPPLPQIVPTSGTSLSNININNSSINSVNVNANSDVNGAKPTKSTQSVSGIDEASSVANPEMTTFRRARSELQSKGSTSSKTIFNPPSHPVSLEVINNNQPSKLGPDNPLTTNTQLNKGRENVSQMDSSISFLEPERFAGDKDKDKEKEIGDKNMEQEEKTAVGKAPESLGLRKSGPKQPVFSSVYHKDFDSSDDGDESEISLCAPVSSKGKSQLSRKAKTSKQSNARKVRYSASNRKRLTTKQLHTQSGRKGHTLKFIQRPYPFIAHLDPNQDLPNDFGENFCETFLSSNSSSASNSSSNSCRSVSPPAVPGEDLNPLMPSTSTGITEHAHVVLKRGRKRPIRSLEVLSKQLKMSPAQLLKYTSYSEVEPLTGALLVPQKDPQADSNANPTDKSTHFATSHEDTSIGAVHVFQDEKGNWLTYTFDENSAGIARGLNQARNKQSAKSDLISGATNSVHIDMNSGGDPFVVLNEPSTSSGPGPRFVKINTRPDTPAGFYDLINAPDSLGETFKGFTQVDSVPPILEAPASSEYFYSFNNTFGPTSVITTRERPKKNCYYEMNIFNIRRTKIRFDRLALLAFLDRNLNLFELISSIVLAICVAVFASIIISHNFFHDLQLVLFCLVVASSQYTLLKSVQPDAASPTHGFNRVTIYGRPIYFCLASLVLLLSHEYVTNYERHKLSFEIYGLNLFDRPIIDGLFYFSKLFLLCFPLLFVFGFLPQINTFLMFLLEQVDIHCFGGTAATIGLASATYSVLRSVLSVSFISLCGHILAIDQDYGAKFSVFCGLTVSISYHLSRLPTNPSLYWNLFKSFKLAAKCLRSRLQRKPPVPERQSRCSRDSTSRRASFDSRFSFKSHSLHNLTDPLPHKIRQIKNIRFQSDLVTCTFIGIIVFGAHVSSIFKLQPIFNNFLTCLVLAWGFLLHYVLIKFRKQLPWLLFSHPILKPDEYQQWDVPNAAKIMMFERFQAWLWLLEKNIVLPLFFLGYLTTDCPLLIKHYGSFLGILFLVVCSVKAFRSGYNDPSSHYMIILFTHLLFIYDLKVFQSKDNIFLMNFFFVSIIYHKIYDLLLKMRFVVTYVAPWQITWGSAFHAFAQPFSVPHSAMLLVQVLISSLLSSPLQPLMGSAIFLASYVRPIKFWERDYNTKRVDHSNTRLASQIDNANIGSDDNNLNSIFYEHLTRSLQHSLYGDLALGRWGDVSQGDCFVLAGYSDNLNCLVHIIELGNGMVTFQLRGLEFRGTYCQQREVEAITESVSDDEGCCCCEIGHFRGLLSVNAAFNQRWLSWEVTQPNYILEGYSISVNSANTILQPYEFRKGLITNYVKSIIYFCIGYKKFRSWLTNEELKESLSYLDDCDFVDLDPTFNHNIDEDFDFLTSGITRKKFRQTYIKWIRYCVDRKMPYSDANFAREHIESVISLCFGLSLLARRAIGIAAQSFSVSLNVEFFLYGLHALFKGDFRVHCPRDEWVFQDMAFLDQVIAPSVRMSLKLHQDQFTTMDEHIDEMTLYEAISEISQTIVISHEADPVWRNAILSNVPSLLALRHVLDEGADQYKVIMLNKRFLNFRIIKINRECVRGLWAGQQQELIFLRNSNPERGSIQNAKQALRNIINSSCDQPIGYPIYVSPLTTSFAETSDTLPKVIGPPVTLAIFTRAITNFFQKIRNRCREVCSGSGSGTNDYVMNHRVSKSESSDRGLDDSISFGNKTISSQVSKYPMKNLVPSKIIIQPTTAPAGTIPVIAIQPQPQSSNNPSTLPTSELSLPSKIVAIAETST